jgi:hypothetical protein
LTVCNDLDLAQVWFRVARIKQFGFARKNKKFGLGHKNKDVWTKAQVNNSWIGAQE